MVVLAGSDYVDALREREVFEGRPTALETSRKTHTALPPKASVRFPFQEQDFDGMFEQMAWLSERAEELEATAAPTQTSELSAFDAGYERDQARWQLDRPNIDIESTEQAGLGAFKEVPDQYIATEQQQLGASSEEDIESR